jgi:hypothetical protein
MYACDSSEFKDKFFVREDIQQEPNISGAREKENTLSGIHLHTTRTPPLLGEYTSNLVAMGRKWESLLEVADSELCTASYKSDTILRLNFTLELTWHP